MSTTSQKLQCLKIKRPKHTLCPKFLPRWQYGTADTTLVAYSSLHSWSFQIHCMRGQPSAADCYKYAAFTLRSVQLVVTDIPYACSDLYSWLLKIYRMHVQICTSAGYTYTVCMFRSVQLLVIDIPYACSDTYSQLL